jgi:hypothetical protein
MPRKSTFGGEAKVTPLQPTPVEGESTGDGSLSGQYPGVDQDGLLETGPSSSRLGVHGDGRGTDPALQGHYVHGDDQRPHLPAGGGKTQVYDPNTPSRPFAGGTLGPMGGQFPSLKVPMTYGEGFDTLADPTENLAGAMTSGPQARERNVGAPAKHYPGIPQVIEDFLSHASDTNPQLGLDESLAPREVGGSGYRNARNVARADTEQGDGKDYTGGGHTDDAKAEPGAGPSQGAAHHG